MFFKRAKFMPSADIKISIFPIPAREEGGMNKKKRAYKTIVG